MVPPMMASSIPTLRSLRAWIDARQAQDPGSGTWWTVLFLLVPLSLVERWIHVFLVRPPARAVYSDMQGYVERAQRLGQPDVVLNRFDTFFPPGTHVLMAPPFRFLQDRAAALWVDQWLWWWLAVGTVVLAGVLALRLFRHPMPAALTMVAVIAYWPLSSYAGYFTSEIPVMFFMLATLLCGLKGLHGTVQRKRIGWWAATGLLAGITLTIRPQFIISVAFLCIPLLRKRFPFFTWKDVLPLALAGALPCVGAVALNSHAAGMRVGIASNGGFNFYQGHCDVHTVETRSTMGWYTWASPARVQYFQLIGREPTKVVHQGHMAWENDHFIDLGLQCIREEGLAHLKRIAINVASLFLVMPWPQVNERWRWVTAGMNWLYAVVLFTVIVPGGIMLARRRKAERFLLLQLAAMLPVGFIIYGDSRFRIPYDLFGILILVGLITHSLGQRRDPLVRLTGTVGGAAIPPPPISGDKPDGIQHGAG